MSTIDALRAEIAKAMKRKKAWRFWVAFVNGKPLEGHATKYECGLRWSSGIIRVCEIREVKPKKRRRKKP
jgi:hypothetical protein